MAKMTKTQTRYPKKGFPRRVEGRISEERYQELVSLISRDSTLTISELIRRILQNQPIKIQVRDKGLSEVMELMVSLDGQLNKIGSNLNQVVKEFHGNSGSLQKFLLGKKLLAFRSELDEELRKLREVLAVLQVKWLSE